MVFHVLLFASLFGLGLLGFNVAWAEVSISSDTGTYSFLQVVEPTVLAKSAIPSQEIDFWVQRRIPVMPSGLSTVDTEQSHQALQSYRMLSPLRLPF